MWMLIPRTIKVQPLSLLLQSKVTTVCCEYWLITQTPICMIRYVLHTFATQHFVCVCVGSYVIVVLKIVKDDSNSQSPLWYRAKL